LEPDWSSIGATVQDEYRMIGARLELDWGLIVARMAQCLSSRQIRGGDKGVCGILCAGFAPGSIWNHMGAYRMVIG
jgi:hypothetical protein